MQSCCFFTSRSKSAFEGIKSLRSAALLSFRQLLELTYLVKLLPTTFILLGRALWEHTGSHVGFNQGKSAQLSGKAYKGTAMSFLKTMYVVAITYVLILKAVARIIEFSSFNPLGVGYFGC